MKSLRRFLKCKYTTTCLKSYKVESAVILQMSYMEDTGSPFWGQCMIVPSASLGPC